MDVLKLRLFSCLVLMYSFAGGQPQGTMPAGRVRTYYIAADEVDWDYAPSGKDLIHGEKYQPSR